MLLSSGSSNKTIYWTAVGVQQWGAMSPGNSTKYNMQINFPISFTTMPYSIIVHQLQNSGSAGAMGWWYVEALTASSFTMKWQCDCFWITVGKQQWGECVGSGYGTSIKFPLPFQNNKYLQMATPYTTGGFWQAPMTVWYDSDLSSIYAGAYGGAEYLKAGYIVLGVQQWGYVPKGNRDKVLFPLVFNTLYTLTGIQDSNAGSAYELKTQNIKNDGFEQNSYQSCYGSLGWISLGVQQWGLYQTQSSATIAFPVTFISTTCSVVSTAYNLTSDASNVYVYAGISSYTNSNFSVYAAKNAKGRMWLAVGY